MKDHGGEIKVESEEGKGTTFIISLPIESRDQVSKVP
jgi:signal transduction histidine kinase